MMLDVQYTCSNLQGVFREQCEEIRTVECRRREQQVISEWATQVKSRQEQLQLKQEEKKIFDDLWEADWRAKEEREAQRVQKEQQKNMQQLGFIKEQMEAQEKRRREQKKLADEEARLMVFKS